MPQTDDPSPCGFDVLYGVKPDPPGAASIRRVFLRDTSILKTSNPIIMNYYDYVDGLRESKLRPVLERLLPVLLMSAWGEVPADVDIQFPPLWTPTAREVADIAKAKTETVINAFQAGLMDRSEAMQELKKLSDETGLFESIAEDSIAAAAGQTYQDVTALKDPLAGIVGGEVSDPFDGTATDAAAFDWHGQPREDNRRFTFGKLNRKPSSTLKTPRNSGRMSSKEKARVSSEILTWHPEYKAGETRSHFHKDHYYQFEVKGPGEYRFSLKMRIAGNERRIDELEEYLNGRTDNS
jgi:hypothetical protein